MKLFQKSKASSNQVGIVILVFYNYIFIYVRISTLYSCTQTVACTSTVTTLTGVAPLSHLPCPLYKKRKRATLLLVKKITLSTLLYYYICCSFLLSILFFILYLLMYFITALCDMYLEGKDCYRWWCYTGVVLLKKIEIVIPV